MAGDPAADPKPGEFAGRGVHGSPLRSVPIALKLALESRTLAGNSAHLYTRMSLPTAHSAKAAVAIAGRMAVCANPFGVHMTACASPTIAAAMAQLAGCASTPCCACPAPHGGVVSVVLMHAVRPPSTAGPVHPLPRLNHRCPILLPRLRAPPTPLDCSAWPDIVLDWLPKQLDCRTLGPIKY